MYFCCTYVQKDVSIKLSSHQELFVVTIITGSVLKSWMDPAPACFPMMAVLGVFIPYLVGLFRLPEECTASIFRLTEFGSCVADMVGRKKVCWLYRKV
jgi:hypothetical protein